MIEVKWEILEEEGRVIKAVFDLAKIPYRLLPKSSQQIKKSQQTYDAIIIDSVNSLKLLAQEKEQLKVFFGQTKQQQNMVQNLLKLYDQNIKQALRVPILEYFKMYQLPLSSILLRDKLKRLIEAVKIVEILLSHRKTKFICGDSITIIDLLLYFDICNLTYFKKNHSDYPHITDWFIKVYSIKQVKGLTHQWFSMAKQIARTIGRVNPKPKI